MCDISHSLLASLPPGDLSFQSFHFALEICVDLWEVKGIHFISGLAGFSLHLVAVGLDRSDRYHPDKLPGETGGTHRAVKAVAWLSPFYWAGPRICFSQLSPLCPLS